MVKEINDNYLSISIITPERYLEGLDVNQIILKSEVEPYILPTKIPLLEYKAGFPDNLYMFIGHGRQTEFNIVLGKNQKIILICDTCPLKSYGKDSEWDLVMKSETSSNFIQNLKENTKISDQLCVFEGSVPNLKLSPLPDVKQDPKYYRFGLYKIPLLYDVDFKQKCKFLKQNMPQLHRISKISKKKSIHDISRNRPYLKITSEHMYHDLKKGSAPIYLQNIIDTIIKEYNNQEFTLVLFACRNVSNRNNVVGNSAANHDYNQYSDDDFNDNNPYSDCNDNNPYSDYGYSNDNYSEPDNNRVSDLEDSNRNFYFQGLPKRQYQYRLYRPSSPNTKKSSIPSTH